MEVEVGCPEYFIIDIQLMLLGSGIADPDRPRTAIAGELMQNHLAQIPSPSIRYMIWGIDDGSASVVRTSQWK